MPHLETTTCSLTECLGQYDFTLFGAGVCSLSSSAFTGPNAQTAYSINSTMNRVPRTKQGSRGSGCAKKDQYGPEEAVGEEARQLKSRYHCCRMSQQESEGTSFTKEDQRLRREVQQAKKSVLRRRLSSSETNSAVA